MPRPSKKRRIAANKKQKNRQNNHSSSSARSHGNEDDAKRSDENQSGVVPVEKEPSNEEGIIKQNGVYGEATGKSSNGGGSSSSGNSSDDDVNGTKNSLTAEDISSVEEMENGQSESEKIPLLVERVKTESLLVDDEKSVNKVGDHVGTSVERNKEGIVQSDNRAEQEKDSSVTQPLLVPEKKTSWRSCCGLFEMFSGSG